VSDRRAWARRVLTTLATETWRGREGDETFRTVLLTLATDPRIEALVAKFGAEYPPLPHVTNRVERDPSEDAARRIIHGTAFALSDADCRMVPAKTVLRTREQIESAIAKAETLSATPVRDIKLGVLDALASVLAPLDDPIVERHRPTTKVFGRKPMTAEERDHVRGAHARVRDLARWLFGREGDKIATIFVTVASGVEFTRDDLRKRGARLRRK
jgi:hypothetical protein